MIKVLCLDHSAHQALCSPKGAGDRRSPHIVPMSERVVIWQDLNDRITHPPRSVFPRHPFGEDAVQIRAAVWGQQVVVAFKPAVASEEDTKSLFVTLGCTRLSSQGVRACADDLSPPPFGCRWPIGPSRSSKPTAVPAGSSCDNGANYNGGDKRGRREESHLLAGGLVGRADPV
jgi:hypothetical protein